MFQIYFRTSRRIMGCLFLGTSFSVSLVPFISHLMFRVFILYSHFFFPISRLIWTFSSPSANQHSVPVFSILTFSMFPCSIFMFFVIRFPPFCSFLFRSPSSCSLLFILHLLVLHVCVFSVLMFSIIFSIFHLPHLCSSSLGSPSLCSLSLGRLLWWESSWSMCSSSFCSSHLVCLLFSTFISWFFLLHLLPPSIFLLHDLPLLLWSMDHWSPNSPTFWLISSRPALLLLLAIFLSFSFVLRLSEPAPWMSVVPRECRRRNQIMG